MPHLLKRQVYSGLMDILNDNKYYYDSKASIDFNKFTEDGKKVVLDYVTIMAPHMLRKEEELLDARAKELVMEELKK